MVYWTVTNTEGISENIIRRNKGCGHNWVLQHATGLSGPMVSTLKLGLCHVMLCHVEIDA